ncbi:MAG: ABC transporter permease [Patescibacteria group bacterium]
MILDYFKLAVGNLKHRGIRSWLTILGIFIGIAAVVALISMGAGLKSAVLGQFGTLSVDKLTIQNKGTGFGPPGSTVVQKLNDNDIKIIENVRGVDLVVPRLIRIVKVEYNQIPSYTYIGDLPDSKEKADVVYESFDIEIDEGRLLKPDDSGKILLGYDFANTKTFEKDLGIGKKIQINGKDFEIVGILKKSSSFQLNSIIIMPTKDLQELLEIKDEWDLIVAQVQDKNKIEEVAVDIEDALRKDRNEKVGEETFSVETPLQALGSVNTILNIINAIVVGIAMISLVVGGVGIANTMYTSVVERTKEIGIMKAIGAKNKDILWIFLIESGLLGLVGGIVGALIGLGGAIGVSNIANSALGTDLFIISVNYYLLIGAIAFSFLIGILFGVLPALQASKLKPVDALRS